MGRNVVIAMRKLVLLLCLLVPVASACPSLVVGSERYLQTQAQELAVQSQLADELAARADAVFVGEVMEQGDGTAQMRVQRSLKGTLNSVFQVRTPGQGVIGTIGCWSSSRFGDATLIRGETVLVYLVAGAVVRAASQVRGDMDLPLDDELAIVARSIGASS